MQHRGVLYGVEHIPRWCWGRWASVRGMRTRSSTLGASRISGSGFKIVVYGYVLASEL